MTEARDAEEVVKSLRKNGFEAYWVGGCVRDMLLHREPKDFDVITNATPDQLTELFPNHYDVGKVFGVIMVRMSSITVEVATYRSEEGYSDRRRPDQVIWSDARDDVVRRDFTINGLLYDPVEKQLLDYVEGERDLKLGIIRCIGSAQERLIEDPLRILRAVRLKNNLGFQYDQETYRAIIAQALEIKHVSMERIGHELSLMLGDKSRLNAIKDLDQLGILKILIPELDETKGVPQPLEFHGEGDVFAHLLRALGTIPKNSPGFLAWAVLLHDIAKPQTLRYPPPVGGVKPNYGRITTYGHAKASAEVSEAILSRLRMPKIEIETVSWLIENHMSLARLDQLRPNKREQFVLDPRFPWLLELHHADAAGAIPVDLSLYNEALSIYKKLKSEHELQKVTTPTSLIDGHDLIQRLGLEPGPKIAEILESVRDAQLQKKLTTFEEAIEYARSLR